MNNRFNAINTLKARSASKAEVSKQDNHRAPKKGSSRAFEQFGKHVFSHNLMKKVLPGEVYKNISEAANGITQINSEYADIIANAIKEWAISHGALHYTHWFQPLTGATAEKHDSFINWKSPNEVIEKFSGSQLIKGEPDASSFPSGGLRSTFEARGYTGWDPSSPVFLWKGGDGLTLCIPSIFFSWTGHVLDNKIPLLRSERIINNATLRLLELTKVKANHITSSLGLEQEYFIIDRSLRNLRPDLVLLGKTVYGAPSPRGQELQDHYFATIKDRILRFMFDFEQAAMHLGIPIKTRHNEVAPAQHEVVPLFEKASLASDHNLLLMELMRQIAVKHELSCLLHEKPFNALNGSGKHSNWSLSTDKGINLLDPAGTPENNLYFLILLTAILNGVHRHAGLLRASIGSAGNDYRLGGHEAPPAIISIYLGQALETLLEDIEKKGSHVTTTKKAQFDFKPLVMPDLTKDETDRNRTSPFAFTGNKFEFRAVGSSANVSWPATILNLIVAESLNEMLDEVEQQLAKKGSDKAQSPNEIVINVVRKYLKNSKDIRFSGDNYSPEWNKEAKRRNLPNIANSLDAFEALKTKETSRVFTGVLTPQELASRYEIQCEIYIHNVNIEVKLMIDLFRTSIFPAAIQWQNTLAKSISRLTTATNGNGKNVKGQLNALEELTHNIENALTLVQELESIYEKAISLPFNKKKDIYINQLLPKAEQLRHAVDLLETKVDNNIWPFPKYRELLFMT